MISKHNPDSVKGVYEIPGVMKAIRYNNIQNFSLVTLPVPQPKAHEILIKGKIPRTHEMAGGLSLESS